MQTDLTLLSLSVEGYFQCKSLTCDQVLIYNPMCSLCITCQHTEALSFPFQQMIHAVVSEINPTSPFLLWNMSCLPRGILHELHVWYDITVSFKVAQTLRWTNHRKTPQLITRWATPERILQRLVWLSRWQHYSQVYIFLSFQPSQDIFCDVWKFDWFDRLTVLLREHYVGHNYQTCYCYLPLMS